MTDEVEELPVEVEAIDDASALVADVDAPQIWSTATPFAVAIVPGPLPALPIRPTSV